MFQKRHSLLTCKHVYLKYSARALNATLRLVSMVAKDGQNERCLTNRKQKDRDTATLYKQMPWALEHGVPAALRRHVAECALPSVTPGG